MPMNPFKSPIFTPLANSTCLLLFLLLCMPYPAPSMAQATEMTEEIKIQRSLAGLPEKTRETYDRIKAAAHSGDVEELRSAAEWNELPPETGTDQNINPIDYWKKISSDGSARDIMATMLNILEQGFITRKHQGGTSTYIWHKVIGARVYR